MVNDHVRAATDLHYGLTVRSRRLREAIGPLAACGQRGKTVRATNLLAHVTCERCRDMVESAGVAVWEIEAEKIEASYRREVRASRRKLVFDISKAVWPIVVLLGVLVGVMVVIWQTSA